MPTCRTCARDLPADGFYASNKSKCKDCVRSTVSAHRAANLERVQAYDRQRGGDAHRKLAVKARAERYRDRKPLYISKYNVNYPEKRAAVTAVNNALRGGRLVRQPCERCGTNLKVQAHHDDYSRPLDVRWLCPPHHGERHRELNEMRRQGSGHDRRERDDGSRLMRHIPSPARWPRGALANLKKQLADGVPPSQCRVVGVPTPDVKARAAKLSANIRHLWSPMEIALLTAAWNRGENMATVTIPGRPILAIYSMIHRLKAEGVIEPRGQGKGGRGPQKEQSPVERAAGEMYADGAFAFDRAIGHSRFEDDERAVSAGLFGRVIRPVSVNMMSCAQLCAEMGEAA